VLLFSTLLYRNEMHADNGKLGFAMREAAGMRTT